MSKVLVTGGLGFIGSNLVIELKSRGHDVWACDLFNSEEPDYERCDVREYRLVENLLGKGFDLVYHAAAEYGRWNGEEYYENLWNTNAVGTKNILREQERRKFRMVFFGSAEVYGDYEGTMSEDVMEKVPLKQMNDYAMSKWVNEMQILNSASMFGTETMRVRLFNVYGPGEYYTPYRGFVPKFIYHALLGRPYTVYKGHKRTLEYIGDICAALAQIADRFKPGEVYNLGSPRQHDIKEVSDIVLKTVGRDDSLVTYKDAEGFTTRVKTPDSTKAVRDLGLKFHIGPEEGIRNTVAWFRKTYRVGE
jgi:dTDP-glucose 4,6-dehydratase